MSVADTLARPFAICPTTSNGPELHPSARQARTGTKSSQATRQQTREFCVLSALAALVLKYSPVAREILNDPSPLVLPIISFNFYKLIRQ